MIQSPLAAVKARFGTKEKLVDALLGSLEKKESESKDDLRKRMLMVSSSQLLRLHARTTKKTEKPKAKPKAKAK